MPPKKSARRIPIVIDPAPDLPILPIHQASQLATQMRQLAIELDKQIQTECCAAGTPDLVVEPDVVMAGRYLCAFADPDELPALHHMLRIPQNINAARHSTRPNVMSGLEMTNGVALQYTRVTMRRQMTKPILIQVSFARRKMSNLAAQVGYDRHARYKPQAEWDDEVEDPQSELAGLRASMRALKESIWFGQDDELTTAWERSVLELLDMRGVREIGWGEIDQGSGPLRARTMTRWVCANQTAFFSYTPRQEMQAELLGWPSRNDCEVIPLEYPYDHEPVRPTMLQWSTPIQAAHQTAHSRCLIAYIASLGPAVLFEPTLEQVTRLMFISPRRSYSSSDYDVFAQRYDFAWPGHVGEMKTCNGPVGHWLTFDRLPPRYSAVVKREHRRLRDVSALLDCNIAMHVVIAGTDGALIYSFGPDDTPADLRATFRESLVFDDYPYRVPERLADPIVDFDFAGRLDAIKRHVGFTPEVELHAEYLLHTVPRAYLSLTAEQVDDLSKLDFGTYDPVDLRAAITTATRHLDEPSFVRTQPKRSLILYPVFNPREPRTATLKDTLSLMQSEHHSPHCDPLYELMSSAHQESEREWWMTGILTSNSSSFVRDWARKLVDIKHTHSEYNMPEDVGWLRRSALTPEISQAIRAIGTPSQETSVTDAWLSGILRLDDLSDGTGAEKQILASIRALLRTPAGPAIARMVNAQVFLNRMRGIVAKRSTLGSRDVLMANSPAGDHLALTTSHGGKKAHVLVYVRLKRTEVEGMQVMMNSPTQEAVEGEYGWYLEQSFIAEPGKLHDRQTAISAMTCYLGVHYDLRASKVHQGDPAAFYANCLIQCLEAGVMSEMLCALEPIFTHMVNCTYKVALKALSKLSGFHPRRLTELYTLQSITQAILAASEHRIATHDAELVSFDKGATLYSGVIALTEMKNSANAAGRNYKSGLKVELKVVNDLAEQQDLMRQSFEGAPAVHPDRCWLSGGQAEYPDPFFGRKSAYSQFYPADAYPRDELFEASFNPQRYCMADPNYVLVAYRQGIIRQLPGVEREFARTTIGQVLEGSPVFGTNQTKSMADVDEDGGVAIRFSALTSVLRTLEAQTGINNMTTREMLAAVWRDAPSASLTADSSRRLMLTVAVIRKVGQLGSDREISLNSAVFDIDVRTLDQLGASLRMPLDAASWGGAKNGNFLNLARGLIDAIHEAGATPRALTFVNHTVPRCFSEPVHLHAYVGTRMGDVKKFGPTMSGACLLAAAFAFEGAISDDIVAIAAMGALSENGKEGLLSRDISSYLLYHLRRPGTIRHEKAKELVRKLNCGREGYRMVGQRMLISMPVGMVEGSANQIMSTVYCAVSNWHCELISAQMRRNIDEDCTIDIQGVPTRWGDLTDQQQRAVCNVIHPVCADDSSFLVVLPDPTLVKYFTTLVDAMDQRAGFCRNQEKSIWVGNYFAELIGMATDFLGITEPVAKKLRSASLSPPAPIDNYRHRMSAIQLMFASDAGSFIANWCNLVYSLEQRGRIGAHAIGPVPFQYPPTFGGNAFVHPGLIVNIYQPLIEYIRKRVSEAPSARRAIELALASLTLREHSPLVEPGRVERYAGEGVAEYTLLILRPAIKIIRAIRGLLDNKILLAGALQLVDDVNASGASLPIKALLISTARPLGPDSNDERLRDGHRSLANATLWAGQTRRRPWSFLFREVVDSAWAVDDTLHFGSDGSECTLSIESIDRTAAKALSSSVKSRYAQYVKPVGWGPSSLAGLSAYVNKPPNNLGDTTLLTACRLHGSPNAVLANVHAVSDCFADALLRRTGMLLGDIEAVMGSKIDHRRWLSPMSYIMLCRSAPNSTYALLTTASCRVGRLHVAQPVTPNLPDEEMVYVDEVAGTLMAVADSLGTITAAITPEGMSCICQAIRQDILEFQADLGLDETIVVLAGMQRYPAPEYPALLRVIANSRTRVQVQDSYTAFVEDPSFAIRYTPTGSVEEQSVSSINLRAVVHTWDKGVGRCAFLLDTRNNMIACFAPKGTRIPSGLMSGVSSYIQQGYTFFNGVVMKVRDTLFLAAEKREFKFAKGDERLLSFADLQVYTCGTASDLPYCEAQIQQPSPVRFRRQNERLALIELPDDTQPTWRLIGPKGSCARARFVRVGTREYRLAEKWRREERAERVWVVDEQQRDRQFQECTQIVVGEARLYFRHTARARRDCSSRDYRFHFTDGRSVTLRQIVRWAQLQATRSTVVDTNFHTRVIDCDTGLTAEQFICPSRRIPVDHQSLVDQVMGIGVPTIFDEDIDPPIIEDDVPDDMIDDYGREWEEPDV